MTRAGINSPASVRRCRPQAFGALLLVCAFALTGCGGTSDGPALYSVHGQVQFDGMPVEKGRIAYKMESADQKSYSGEIFNGEYKLEAEPGPAVVSITATRGTGKFDDQGGAAEPVPIEEMYIPKQYNAESTVKKEITAGDNEISFDIKSM